MQLLASLLAQQLRVAQTLRHAAHARVEDGEPDGHRSGDRAAPDLVAPDDERCSLTEQRPLEAERRVGGHPPADSVGDGDGSGGRGR